MQRRVFDSHTANALLSADLAMQVGNASPFHPELEILDQELARASPFERISAWELRTYMADVLLRDSDTMSMRHSLELRVPFVDRPLVEWLWRQPARFRNDPRRPKSALAEATADILPPGMQERKKRGFTLPFPFWMRKELRPFLEDVFSITSVAKSGLFSPGAVQALWSDFASGGEDRDWSRVWSTAVLIAFVNRRHV
jgi:asparagine synthase (glutamine-hydrolysing)